MNDIEARVKKVAAAKLDRKVEDIELNHAFVTDLGADSLDAVELMMGFEDEFEIEIPDETAEGMLTVKSVVDFISEALATQ